MSTLPTADSMQTTVIGGGPEMLVAAFLTHLILGAAFIFIGYLAYENKVPVLPWTIPIGIALAYTAIMYRLFIQGNLNMWLHGTIASAAGITAGAGIVLSTVKPREKPRGNNAEEFKI